jgi:hypothetical protein
MNKTAIDWADYSWNPVPEHDGYFASYNGLIMSIKRKRPIIMRQITSKDGYKYVFMYSNGIMKKVWVHRAVLSACRGFEEKELECRHLDDNPSNNRLENLEWGSRLENVNDKRKNDRLPYGERSGTHKLTEKQVLEIRALYGKIPSRTLGKIYGVSHCCIRRAALGIKWGYLNAKNKN